jgi:CheY-like chemotaxis protein
MEILIADDDESSRLYLELAARSLAYSASTAENGVQVLEMLEQFAFDAVLVDIEMPVLGGIETLRRIRANPAHQKLRVYGITAHSDGPELEAVRQAGFTCFLTKPVSPAALAAVLSGQCATSAGTAREARPLVDRNVLGEYQNLLRSAGMSPAATVKRTLDEVSRWLDGGPGCRPASREAAHALAGSCAVIGACALLAELKELERLASAGSIERWEASLLKARQTLRETNEAYGSLLGRFEVAAE